MLEKIKLSIRIFHNAIDADIQDNIATCMLDLQRVGIHANVATESSQDKLICKAAELYYKWQIDYNGKGEKFQKAYESLRDALSFCEEYTEGGTTDV